MCSQHIIAARTDQHVMFNSKQARQLEDWWKGERVFWGGEKTGGESGGEQPKSWGVKKQQTSFGNVKGRKLNIFTTRLYKYQQSLFQMTLFTFLLFFAVRTWNFCTFLFTSVFGEKKERKTRVHWDEDGLDLVSGRILLKSISKHPPSPMTCHPSIP